MIHSVALAVAAVGQIIVIAAGEITNDPWVDGLLKGGPFAVVVLLIIMDRLTTPGERDRLRNENTEMRNEIKDLNADVRNNVMPLVARNTELLAQATEALMSPRTSRTRRED